MLALRRPLGSACTYWRSTVVTVGRSEPTLTVAGIAVGMGAVAASIAERADDVAAVWAMLAMCVCVCECVRVRACLCVCV